MKFETIVRSTRGRWGAGLVALMLLAIPACSSTTAGTAIETQMANQVDPRVGLSAGLHDAGQAAMGMEHVVNLPRPEGFSTNSDLAFSGDYAFMGNYNGFNVYDISSPPNPELRVSVICPGNQGDLSVYGNLLFHSVQATSGRLDCGTEGVSGEVSPERFRGVRIFDISDIDNPMQVAAVQTCRGSHTHSLVSNPQDDDNVYVYVSGTSGPRPAAELPGCSDLPPDEDPNTSLFRIEVIQVPLAAPQNARIVSEPRVFADPQTGEIAGLWEGGDHGPGTQRTSATRACHDITSYPDLGLAGGACSGNGILLDISNPVNPVRLDEVADPNFAYWHSATFNNEGTTVLFTDEWGGGGAPRCQATDPPNWGGNSIYRLVNGEMQHAGYYKLPAPQTEWENCVAHNGSLVPVPGRDIKVQAWYQGGISVFDFTDPANPYEIAFFDRGPISDTEREGGGFWSAYWYNGHIYGSEMARGLDVFHLTPTEHLSSNELAAARAVRMDQFNAQHQPRFEWPANISVSRAYLDQLERNGGLARDRIANARAELDRAEQLSAPAQRRDAFTQLAAQLEADVQTAGDAERVRDLAESVRRLAAEG
ncbi:MAG: hypothetical protein WD737_08100 [Gemmatimonadota bacterium]